LEGASWKLSSRGQICGLSYGADMRLIDALRLSRSSCIALTGSGGKSSALFRLGREFLGRVKNSLPGGKQDTDLVEAVILAATTHLAAAQASLADIHITLENDSTWDQSHIPAWQGLILFTGTDAGNGRLHGIHPAKLGPIREFARLQGVPLIIEADGSRQRPLKAPAPQEPVVPHWVDEAIVLAGLSGLDRPLGEETVFRPEIFAELAGMRLGELVTVERLAGVLCHASGGLKGIPAGARRSVLFNQASTPELKSAAQRLAQLLLPGYAAVVAADLPYAAQDPGKDTGEAIVSIYERTAGIILAAGAARRFGQLKQTMEWHGKPLVRHAAETALASGLAPVIVVLGYEAGSVRAALAGLDLKFVENPDWQDGMATSVTSGVAALDPNVGAAVFLLADQPRLSSGLVRSLLEVHVQDLASIVAPIVDGQRANPVLFDRRTFSDLSRLTGDVGGRAIFKDYPIRWLPWNDSSILLDIDSPQDYQTLLES
jgi:molybdenum cofactor cytidylyltransferase